MRHLPAILAALLLVAATPGHVPEPAALWQGALHGYTPNTVTGATVVDTAKLDELLRDEHPVLVDVADADHKPDNMPPGALWMPTHRSVPGATWLPGAGSGTSDPAFEQAFEARLSALTSGSKAQALVVFCHPDCWGSWNAAKRLVVLGYTRVYWYPEGMEGWQAVHDTIAVKVDSSWSVPKPSDRIQ